MSGERSNNDIFGGSPGDRAKMTGMPVRNTMKDDFGLDIPTELVPLPSGGKVYPEGPLHNVEAVEIRPMTAREEDILTSRALIKKGTVITELIKSCLVDKRINPDDLISGDRNAIMTSLRITGYGSDYTADVECPECGTKSSQAFDLTKLPLKMLECKPVNSGENLFEYKLPYTKKVVKFKFLDGNDEQEITKLQERSKKSGRTTTNSVTLRYRFAIQAIDNITDKTKIQMFIRNMPARDSRALRAYMDKLEPGIDMKSWMACPACGEESEVRMPLGASFFWPDAE